MQRNRSAPPDARGPGHLPDDDERVVWTVREASDRLGLPVPRIYAYVQAGALPAIRLQGRLLIPRDAVMGLVHKAMNDWRGPDAG